MKTIEDIVSKAEKSSNHILTVYRPERSSGGSTGLTVDEEGNLDWEYIWFVENINESIANGESANVILRSFDRSRMVTPPWNKDITIPTKVVRGWYVENGFASPLSEKSMFVIHCTDSKTGEPLPPEETVEYAEAWEV